jgi:methylmalonyl-CoA mutase N-terminal domain/subunit
MSIDESVERDQIDRLRAFRANRKDGSGALKLLDAAARQGQNLMPLIVECVRQECTAGEIVGKLKETFGEHKDQGF